MWPLVISCPLLGSPGKTRVMEQFCPTLALLNGTGGVASFFLCPFLMTPTKARAALPFRQLPGPLEGKGDVAISDFVLIVEGRPRSHGLCNPATHF